MSEINLPQAKADALLAMEKFSVKGKSMNFMDIDCKFEIDLISGDKKEKFVLNYSRNQINLEKRNHHLRTQVVGLVRLDLKGPPHRNPDGEKIGPNHLHLYREGFGLKWAHQIPEDKFPNINNDIKQTLVDFMKYCNINYDFLLDGLFK